MSQSPLRTGRATLMASGSAPLVLLHGGTLKRRFPLRQFHRCPPVDSLRVHWGPLFPSSQRRGAFTMGPHPPGPRLSRAPITLPPPTLHEGLGVSLGAPLPPSHAPSHPSRSLPCAAWQTHTARCRWRVARLAPSALCGSPGLAQRGRQIGLGDHGQRSSGLAVVFPLIARGGLQARLADRAAKGWQGQPFPQGLTTLQVMPPGVPQPSHHLFRACLPRMGPFRSMLLTPESGL